MDQMMFAFGLTGIMLVVGILCRSRFSFLQKILMPAPVIGGIIGFCLLNLFGDRFSVISQTEYTSIVDIFFVLSFISLGLTNKEQKESIDRKERKKLTRKERKALGRNTVVSGAINLGLLWCAIYGIQAFVGGFLWTIVGKPFDLSGMYGILLSFGFSQGPGQASTYGQMFEGTYGLEGAEMIAITFAVVGFLAAFFIGVPIARLGIKKKISNRVGVIGETEKRGVYQNQDERTSLGSTTTYSGNIETITTHVAFMGLAYIITLGFSKAISYVPGIGESFAAMKFFWGMLAANLVRKVLNQLKAGYLLDDMLLGRITAFLTDFVVVAAFLSIQIKALGTLLLPIVIVSVITTLVTLFFSIFFCQRMGSDHDFEKLLGLFGTSTGTVSSGISLIRIVDPLLKSTTAQELGCINIVGILSAPVITLTTLAGIGKISLTVALAGFLISALVDILLLVITGGIQKKSTFELFGKSEDEEVWHKKERLQVE